MWAVPLLPVAALALFITGFSLGPIFPTTIALMSDTLPSRIVPSAIGFIASFGSMGAALLPWIAGNLAQHYGMWVLLPYVIALDRHDADYLGYHADETRTFRRNTSVAYQ